MSGSSIGEYFRVTTFGESHGPGLGAVIDGCPPGLTLDRDSIQRDLDLRRPGQSEATTARVEADRVELLSGTFEGVTTGAPIALLIRNQDARPAAYDELKDLFRPGHADLSYLLKYGLRDHRGGGRASGRETAARVAAGAVARALLGGFGVTARAYVIQVGPIRAEARDFHELEQNPLRCPDAQAAARMLKLILELKAAGDSVGAVVEARVEGAPAGLGDPVFNKLDALLAGALMGIGGVKAVEIGDGFGVAERRGSENSDPLEAGLDGRVRSRHNRAGGILGGISTGEPIVARIAIKPTASIALEQATVNLKGEPAAIKVTGRHDPCLGPRIAPVAEAMTLLVIADRLLAQRAQTGRPGPVGRVGP